jgi:hypothetical protein
MRTRSLKPLPPCIHRTTLGSQGHAWRPVLLALLAASASLSHAQDRDLAPRWDLVLHTISHHFHQPEQARWNNHNSGLAFRRTLGETTAVQAGAYHNSNFDVSAYLIGEWLPLRHGVVSAGAFGGLVSGYRYPVAAGVLSRVDLGAYNATVRFVPKAYDTSSAFVSLELGWRF